MMQFLFNLTLAFRAIRVNRLRSSLTIAIIGLGIMTLVAILTAIEVMKSSIYSNFSSMGANSFQVSSDIIKKKKHKRGGLHISVSEAKNISYEEAKTFKERFNFPSTISISVNCTGIATVHHNSEKTNPNVQVMAADEFYLDVSDTKLDAGRNFTTYDINYGTYTCLLGNGIAKKLFRGKLENAVDRIVSIGDIKYRVLGVMETKGGSMINDADNSVMIPLATARSIYSGNGTFVTTVKVHDISQKKFASEEAEGLFRGIRKLPLGTENNFSINQNDSLATILIDSIKYVGWAAVIIAIITLLGSVIGLMNIMLVSVAERTREIGVSKALGARSSTIKRQFLSESILISLMGGVLGVILGMLVGNLLGLIFHTGFIVPWVWITLGISMCAFVGIISGIYPAIKASKLDPIVALRYE